MLISLELSVGVIFYAKSMLNRVGNFFGGPVVAMIALAITASYRLFLAGAGVLAKVGGWELNLVTGVGARAEQAARIFGLPPEQTLRLGIGVSYFHPENRPKMAAALRQTIDEGKAWDGEFRFIDANGKSKWIHSFSSQVISRGKPINFLGIVLACTHSHG